MLLIHQPNIDYWLDVSRMILERVNDQDLKYFQFYSDDDFFYSKLLNSGQIIFKAQNISEASLLKVILEVIITGRVDKFFDFLSPGLTLSDLIQLLKDDYDQYREVLSLDAKKPYRLEEQEIVLFNTIIIGPNLKSFFKDPEIVQIIKNQHRLFSYLNNHFLIS